MTTTTTWQRHSAATGLTYNDQGRELRAAVWPLMHGGYGWLVLQWGQPLGSGTARRQADAKAAAQQWLDVCTEHTPA